jgi:predicted GH43/DUF377 family glycosyl hydrolase
MESNFVLETKQVKIDGFPHAFNPSIVRWNDKILMSFRVIPDERHPFNSWIGVTWLDDQLHPIGKPQRLYMRDTNSAVPSRIDDARLLTVGRQLYIVYSDNEQVKISKGGYRIYIARLEYTEKKFFLAARECLSCFADSDPNRREKNWVPFDYYGELLLAYTIAPHLILRPLCGTGYCETFVYSDHEPDWPWGPLRGGTPAIMDRDHYLAFFHSSQRIASVQSKGKQMMHYFIGAYTFSTQPPFAITRISAAPIIGQSFYGGTEYKPYWKPVQVVFPCGFIFDKNYIWLAYGKQDHEIWVAKLDKNKLYESLVPLAHY